MGLGVRENSPGTMDGGWGLGVTSTEVAPGPGTGPCEGSVVVLRMSLYGQRGIKFGWKIRSLA